MEVGRGVQIKKCSPLSVVAGVFGRIACSSVADVILSIVVSMTSDKTVESCKYKTSQK